MLISLIVLPGSGQRDVTCPEGFTVGQLFEREGLTGRTPILNGQMTTTSAVLKSGDELAATSAVKGA